MSAHFAIRFVSSSACSGEIALEGRRETVDCRLGWERLRGEGIGGVEADFEEDFFGVEPLREGRFWKAAGERVASRLC